jgi:hypothetical protein
MRNIDNVMYYLDYWVKQHGRYVDPHEVPNEVTDGINLLHILNARKLGIQQVRSEIKEFVELILSKGLDKRVLEIGLGYYGGTHMLWRQLFDEVVTIEYSWLVKLKFKLRERVNGTSKVIVGDSREDATVEKIKLLGKFDMLFIDGDHSYSGVLNDYCRYNGFVRQGGLIAFHDSNCTMKGFGISDFLYELKKGQIDDIRHNVKEIVYSDYVGIAYIEK